MDVLTKKQRSLCMSRIKGKNTKPEVFFRKLVSSNNIRGYRLHAPVKGRPDLYFGKRKIAVFIDGCFWHGCPRCALKPAKNARFWEQKISGNRLRDKKTNRILRGSGVRVLRFWEHQLKKQPEVCLVNLQAAFTAVVSSQEK